MPLGKGLESLIPAGGKKPGQGGSDNAGQNAKPQPATPQPIDPNLGGPALIPEEELPAGLAFDPDNILDAHLVEEALPAPEEPEMELEPEPAFPRLDAPAKESVRSVAPGRSMPEHARKAKDKESEAIYYVEVQKIVPNRSQPRRHFDEDALKDLSASIREFGVLQPIVVTKHTVETSGGADVEYELIAGERRLMASKLLGLERIPAIIRHVDLERERLELAVIENLQREDLNPVEMARAFARLQDEFRLTQREIAARLGKSRETIANTLRLLDLPSYIQEAIEKGTISESHGRLLLGVEDAAARQALFQELLTKGFTTRELREKARRASKKPAISGAEADLPEARMFEQRLASELGAPVSIEGKGDGGKITINFYSEEELRSIIGRIVRED